jgi:hypothetical protein
MAESRRERAIETMRPRDKLVGIVLARLRFYYLDRRNECPRTKAAQNLYNPIMCRKSCFAVVVEDADSGSTAHQADVINPHFKHRLAGKCIGVRKIRGRGRRETGRACFGPPLIIQHYVSGTESTVRSICGAPLWSTS